MPLLLLACLAFAAGVAYRRRQGKASPASVKRRDRRADRVLPASWEQESEMYGLAALVAQRDDRHIDHVLAQYGAFDYARGSVNGMRRKDLTRRQAARIIERIKREEGVEIKAPDKKDLPMRDPLAPREDEEPF